MNPILAKAVHKVVQHREAHKKEHKPEKKKDHHVGKPSKHNFKYPEMKIDDVAAKVKEGYTFRQAKDEDFDNKNAKIVTIHLPKNGYLPFVMVEATQKTIDGGSNPIPVKLASGPDK